MRRVRETDRTCGNVPMEEVRDVDDFKQHAYLTLC